MDKIKRRIFTDTNGVRIPQDINRQDIINKLNELIEGYNENKEQLRIMIGNYNNHINGFQG